MARVVTVQLRYPFREYTGKRTFLNFLNLDPPPPSRSEIRRGTGRQPPPLSSVLYGIIYKRCSVLAAQVLLREKSGA